MDNSGGTSGPGVDSGGASGPGVDNGALPRTGSNTGPLVVGGVTLLALGGATALIAKRRGLV